MFNITLEHYLFLGAILFTIGVLGIFLNKKNLIVILMSIELILLSVNINLISFSIFSGDIVVVVPMAYCVTENNIKKTAFLSNFKAFYLFYYKRYEKN